MGHFILSGKIFFKFYWNITILDILQLIINTITPYDGSLQYLNKFLEETSNAAELIPFYMQKSLVVKIIEEVLIGQVKLEVNNLEFENLDELQMLIAGGIT